MINVHVKVYEDKKHKVTSVVLPNGTVIVNDKRDKDMSFMNDEFIGEEVMVYYHDVRGFKGIFKGAGLIDVNGENITSLEIEETERYVEL